MSSLNELQKRDRLSLTKRDLSCEAALVISTSALHIRGKAAKPPPHPATPPWIKFPQLTALTWTFLPCFQQQFKKMNLTQTEILPFIISY